jgi:glycerol transport system substrate-binding protein
MKNYYFFAFILSWSVSASESTINDLSESLFKFSTLSKEERVKELLWFQKAAIPYKGKTIRVVSEDLPTHRYESRVLTKAFEELTGIRVIHEVTGEHDVVKKIDAQINYEYHIYDAYIADSDLIGLFSRSNQVIPVSHLIRNPDVLFPYMDIDDFMAISFVTANDGEIYQLPDQQFANLYWFRYDWFNDEEMKKRFYSLFGYELGVPLNWTAYRDIADFFTNHIREINGKKVYGHMDYGKNHPSLGWRFSDAWLSMAGMGDPGLPNGIPVDEWGIRVEKCSPVGASVERGGAINGPAAKYALTTYKDWLLNFAPTEAKDMAFSQAGSVPAQGNIAQQIFWYTTFTPEMIKPNTPVTDANGIPRWRMAPSPVGVYWEDGMKKGYQDTGAWTFLRSAPIENTNAAWLYAQFVTSKTVTMNKFLEGLTLIRFSDVTSDFIQKNSHRYGGLIEFYLGKESMKWTPTGTNVPDYTKMSDIWWKSLGGVIHLGESVGSALDNMAEKMDATLEDVSYSNKISYCSPRLNDKKEKGYWLNRHGSPKAKIKQEWPEGKTASYEEVLKLWR